MTDIFAEMLERQPIPVILFDEVEHNAYGMPSGENVPMVQEGKYYECRNGDIAGPMIRNLSRLYDEEWKWTFRGWGAGEVWRDDGTFGARSEYDLMREYIPENA